MAGHRLGVKSGNRVLNHQPLPSSSSIDYGYSTDSNIDPLRLSHHLMAATLLSLPPELLIEILILAGDPPFDRLPRTRTTTHRSAVCRAFRAVCHSTGVDVRYAYVSGTRRIQGFLDMLKRREERGRAVKSLTLVEDHFDGEFSQCQSVAYGMELTDDVSRRISTRASG